MAAPPPSAWEKLASLSRRWCCPGLRARQFPRRNLTRAQVPVLVRPGHRQARQTGVVDALHLLAIVGGIFLALAVTGNIVRTLVIPRVRRTLLLHGVDKGVDALFQLIVWPLRSYERKDQVLAAQGAAVLLAQLAAWLLSYELAYALLLWPTAGVGGLRGAFIQAGSSMFTLGFVYTHGTGPTAIDVLAAATGIAVVALQIAYLPTLYGAFNRRETEVTLLGPAPGTRRGGPSCCCGPVMALPSRTTTSRLSTTGGSAGRQTWRRAIRTTRCSYVSVRRAPFRRGWSGCSASWTRRRCCSRCAQAAT